MRKVACPYCQFAVDDDGTMTGRTVRCPACDRKFTMPIPQGQPLGSADTRTPRHPTNTKSSAAGIFGAVMLVVCVLCFAIYVWNESAPKRGPGVKPRSQSARDDSRRGLESEAYTMAQSFVEGRLVSPGSADFPWAPDSATLIGDTWYIGLHVDSENRMGALTRSTWVVAMKKTASGWECVSITGSQQ